jgi:hypothetical protein
VPAADVVNNALLQQLLHEGGAGIIEKDVKGGFHFNGNFKNANDLDVALQALDHKYESLVKQERTAVLALFEKVFNHKAFTGRSGTFYAYEGLGSIYWHMVSKLLLGAEEAYNKAVALDADKAIIEGLVTHYHNIKEGIGVHKSPQVYGAFPTDPYSHTPAHKGAQQPGMTGQVKEDILTRMGELGVKMKDGQLMFVPSLLSKSEFLTDAVTTTFILLDGAAKKITIEKDCLAFTVFQVPVVYKLSTEASIEVNYANGTKEKVNGAVLSKETTEKMMHRAGEVLQLTVNVHANQLK